MKDEKLAILGGEPIRKVPLPIFRLQLPDSDIEAVTAVLRSGQISRGGTPSTFEADLCRVTGATSAAVVSSGSAALHLAMQALDLPPESEVILPSLTFVATAFAPIYVDAMPIFADIDPDTWTLDPKSVEDNLSARTGSIITVDYAGQVSDIDALSKIIRPRGLPLVQDAAHSIGADLNGKQVGSLSDLTAFSFFATKNITSGEGGAVTTIHSSLGEKIQRLKAHGIVHEGPTRIPGFYDVVDLGFNFHLSNLNIALVRSQLTRITPHNAERHRLATSLREAISSLDTEELVAFPATKRGHAHHLFSARIDIGRLKVSRDEIISAVRAEGVECGVYYRPVHLFSYFQKRFNPPRLPVTEAVASSLITLPLYPGLRDEDIIDVARALYKVLTAYRT